MYFAGFQRSNRVFMENDRGFKKFQLQKKFIIQQIVKKIAKFFNIRQNNSIFTQKEKKKHLKSMSQEITNITNFR